MSYNAEHALVFTVHALRLKYSIKQQLPASIIVIIITPAAAPPLQLAVPADRFRGERIHIDKRCMDVVSSSSGAKTQGPLRAAYLSAGARLERLG